MQRARSSFVLVLLGLQILASTVLSQTDSIDEYIQAEMKKRLIPGIAVAAIRNGAIIKLKGYGFANLEHDVPVTPDTVFELASLTKGFTATAIMLLVEEGKLKLSDPAIQYLPPAPDQWRAITIRHLLTHTAGLASLETGFKSLYEGGARLNYTTAQMFEAATKDPMSFAPGERWQYSDVGYFLLGMIIEKVTGKRWQDFVADRFFKPLGMTSTSVLDQWAIVKNRAAGYTLRNGNLANIRRVEQVELAPHYGIFSSVRDLAKWDIALAAGKVIKPSSLDQMWTAVKLNSGSSYTYGFGWEIGERRGRRMITHTGITGTEYTRFPDDKLTVIVLTNLGVRVSQTGVNSWGLTKGVAGRIMPALLFSSLAERPDANPELTASLRGFLTDLSSGTPTPLMTPGLSAILSQAARNITAARLKELKSFTFLDCDDSKGRVVERNGISITRRCYYKMVSGTQTLYYVFWFSADGKVADFTSLTE